MQQPGTQSFVKRAALRFAVLITVCAGLLGAGMAASASASITYERSIGSGGTGAGQFSRVGSLAINQVTGDIYAVDAGNNRVEQLTEGGQFVRAWGYDVVQSGADNKPPAHEVQEVAIRAASGTFQLRLAGGTTNPIPYNASAIEVEEALNNLPVMKGNSSTVTVTGGPGDIAGSSPYVITFATGLVSNFNVPQFELLDSNLGVPSGSPLTCQASISGFSPSESWQYQWLANGAPIADATSSTYTPTSSDEGKAIQCQVTATWFHAQASMTNAAFHAVDPVPTPGPPVPPASIEAPSGETPQVLGAGGQTLTCNAGGWQGSPTSYTYRWFFNGRELGTPTTTPETSNTYAVQAADLVERGVFQCSVTATNASGASTLFSSIRQTNPQNEPFPSTPVSRVVSPISSKVATRVEGGAAFEVCQANPPSDDVCKAGVTGTSMGQFDFNGASSAPTGIAVDESPLGGGDVYVVDSNNARVQKFTATGTPILEIGGHVNKTTGANLCTVASGDICGGGVPGAARSSGIPQDYSPGVFGLWQPLSFESELGDDVAVDKAGNVYVGDMQQGGSVSNPGSPIVGRIQKFDSGGNYLAQRGIPSKSQNPAYYNQPISVEVDDEGQVFTAIGETEAAIEKFLPGEFTIEPSHVNFADRTAFDESSPQQLAIDPTTQYIWASDANRQTFRGPTHICGETGPARRAILAFDDEGHLLECAVPTGAPEQLSQATGLAISDSGFAFVSTGPGNVIKVFKLPVPKPPAVEGESVDKVTTQSAELQAKINPGFAATSYTFEYGLSDCATSSCQTSVTQTAYGNLPVDVGSIVGGLQPHTRYHYRVLLENSESGGPVYGPDRTFATYAEVDVLNDPCPNALARKQTKTAALLDCRAYELASAESTSGYDVESDLIPGQTPFSLSGQTSGKALYAVHDGGIPGTGNPTNRGPDPYVAVRDAAARRWDTRYVGIPGDNAFSTENFSSTLAEADDGLSTMAFSGDEICSPCFADGSTGIPVHLPDGSLVQGLKGSIPQPAAEPAGYVGRYLSSDGTKLAFGTTAKLEELANGNGDVTLYERNLAVGTTEIVSTLPSGSTISGAEVGELDMSDDGSRILFGKEVSTDGDGNVYWNLYMHFAGSSQSADLTPTSTSGSLFDGMTADGGKVFFTTSDKLLPGQDTDNSADIYEAAIGSAGSVTLSLVSVGSGGPSNDDSCGPNSWNAVSGDGHCNAVAIGGAAGVAEGDGTIYFLSPELLDGSKGTADEPNLYVASPGDAPVFVATLEVDNPLVEHAVAQQGVRHWGDFVTAPGGRFAAFASTEPLAPEYDNAGFAEVYRYDAAAGQLDCASCDPTEREPDFGASLPGHGLGMTDDGRVFFNTAQQLVLRDTNENGDGYEWEDGIVQLISSGTNLFDSGLLGVTADGRDAFFFTREKLVPRDLNGEAMKLYDAREEGGFFEVPEQSPCAASDECHGPGSQAAPPSQVGTLKGSGGQAKAPKPKCRKGFVRKHGKCVKKHTRRKGHHKKHSRTAKKTRGTQR